MYYLISIIFSVLGGIISVSLIVYTLKNYRKLSPSQKIKNMRKVPRKSLGEFERSIKNLVNVIVVADQVEKPSGELLDAVEHNFKRDVKYTFLVSNVNAKTEINGYYLLFKAMYETLKSQGLVSKPIEELLEISRLPYDWTDVPYLFYQYSINQNKSRKTIALRGTQTNEGIADYYEQVPAKYAHSLAKSIFATSPKPLSKEKLSINDFEDPKSNLILFAQSERVKRRRINNG